MEAVDPATFSRIQEQSYRIALRFQAFSECAMTLQGCPRREPTGSLFAGREELRLLHERE